MVIALKRTINVNFQKQINPGYTSSIKKLAPAGVEAARGKGSKGPPFSRHPVEWRQADILSARWGVRADTPSLS